MLWYLRFIISEGREPSGNKLLSAAYYVYTGSVNEEKSRALCMVALYAVCVFLQLYSVLSLAEQPYEKFDGTADDLKT